MERWTVEEEGVAIASQLGEYDHAQGFVKYPWLPRMNTPVFAEPAEYGEDFNLPDKRDFVFGNMVTLGNQGRR